MTDEFRKKKPRNAVPKVTANLIEGPERAGVVKIQIRKTFQIDDAVAIAVQKFFNHELHSSCSPGSIHTCGIAMMGMVYMFIVGTLGS